MGYENPSACTVHTCAMTTDWDRPEFDKEYYEQQRRQDEWREWKNEFKRLVEIRRAEQKKESDLYWYRIQVIVLVLSLYILYLIVEPYILKIL